MFPIFQMRVFASTITKELKSIIINFNENKMYNNLLMHKGQVLIKHLYLLAKDFQHEYQMSLFICLYKIFVKRLLVFLISLLMHLCMYPYLWKLILRM